VSTLEINEFKRKRKSGGFFKPPENLLTDALLCPRSHYIDGFMTF